MRESQTKKIPLTLILGDNEKNNKQVSYRKYGMQDTVTLGVGEFIELLNKCIKNKDINL